MNKDRLLQFILATLKADLAVIEQATKAAYEASIHEENVAEDKYDTLGLEASYLAQGQANRAQEIRQALAAYQQLALRRFDEGAAIRLTALVTLEDGDGLARLIFIGPKAGGLKMSLDGHQVFVITPQSPLGDELLGKEVGDLVTLELADGVREFEIVDLC